MAIKKHIDFFLRAHWCSTGLVIENLNCLADCSSEATPGKVLPASNSKQAPPPVDT